MSGIIAAITAFILSVVYSFFPLEEQNTQPLTKIIQHEGDTVIVQGVTSLPQSVEYREPQRKDGWAPPNAALVTAESYVVMDSQTGRIMYSRDPNRVWPAASITKLMTAIITYDLIGGNKRDFGDQEITITPDDDAEGARYIYEGESVQLEDIFRGMLVGSINSFARTLVRATNKDTPSFIQDMNERARQYGLWNTHFEDVTGLSENNVITAKEGAWLLKESLTYELIQEALLMSSYTFETTDTKRTISIENTNKLLESGIRIEGGKTGHIQAAKYNFAVQVGNNLGDAVLIIVLGSLTEDARFSDTRALAEWTFENYEWRFR